MKLEVEERGLSFYFSDMPTNIFFYGNLCIITIDNRNTIEKQNKDIEEMLSYYYKLGGKHHGNNTGTQRQKSSDISS